MKNKPKRLHPLAALDRHSGSSPEDKPVSAEDRRIDASVATPYEKCCERYARDIAKQLKALDEFEHRQRRAQKYLNYLEQEVKQGYVNGLKELAFIAQAATEMLEHLATDSPDYASVVAQNYGSWPLLCKRNSPDPTIRDLLKKIRLDRGNIDGVPAHQIDADLDCPRTWAFRLLKALQDYRRPVVRDDVLPDLFSSFRIIRREQRARRNT